MLFELAIPTNGNDIGLLYKNNWTWLSNKLMNLFMFAASKVRIIYNMQGLSLHSSSILWISIAFFKLQALSILNSNVNNEIC
jgi:hypothetical protein